MNHLATGACLISGSAVAMLCTSVYFSRHLAVEYRLNGYYAVYCPPLAVGQHLIHQFWIEYTAYGLTAYFAYQWWKNGGGGDTRGRWSRMKKRVQLVRGTAAAKR